VIKEIDEQQIDKDLNVLKRLLNVARAKGKAGGAEEKEGGSGAAKKMFIRVSFKLKRHAKRVADQR
jgi:hypothetical protein